MKMVGRRERAVWARTVGRRERAGCSRMVVRLERAGCSRTVVRSVGGSFRVWVRCLSVLVAACVWGGAWGQEWGGVEDAWNHVTIYRDEWGVPHVSADSVKAMAFGLGYAQAQDHIEGLLLAYRAANGRLAEVEGEVRAESDEFALRMRHGVLAKEAFGAADPVTRDLCQGYADGVNAWLLHWDSEAPLWAEGVAPEDVLALLHYFLMSFAPFDLEGVFHPEPGMLSGNAWAVGPSRSASGEAMLVVSPHGRYGGAIEWAEAQVAMPGYVMAGATVVGLPVILMGHNGLLGWGLAPNEADFADLYREVKMRWTGRGEAPSMKRPDVRVQSAPEEVEYFVKTEGGFEKRTVGVKSTKRGPLVAEDEGDHYYYRVGGYGEFGGLRQLFDMGGARSLVEFRKALAQHQIPCFHVVYADQAGNVFYHYNVKTGERLVRGRNVPEELVERGAEAEREFVWTRPIGERDAQYAWGTTFPFDGLPFLWNPGDGYVQACGTPPWGCAEHSGLHVEAVPVWLAHDRDSYRARRVRWLLGMGSRDFGDMQAMVYDVAAPFAMEAVPKLLECVEKNPKWVANAHPDLPGALEVLRSWDYVAEVNSPGMTLFHLWWSAYRALAPGEWNETDLFEAFVGGELKDEIALQAASDAARLMRNEYDRLSVEWGDVHVLCRGGREAPLPGAVSGDPIFRVSDTCFVGGKWRVDYGPAFAMAVRFGERVEAASVSPFGASDDPNSPHYDDQMQVLLDRRFKVMRFYPEDVERHAASVLGCAGQVRPIGVQGVFGFQSPAVVEFRAGSSVHAPIPLPEGVEPFTVFVRVQHTPREAPVSLGMDVYVPPEVCPGNVVGALALYEYEEGGVWRQVFQQEVDVEGRRVHARGEGSRTYVVLGPKLRRDESEEEETGEASPGLAAGPEEDEGDGVFEGQLGAPGGEEEMPEAVAPDGEVEPPILGEEGDEAGAVDSSQGADDAGSSGAGLEADGLARGAIAWGRSVELSLPGMEGTVSLVAEKTFGARAVVKAEAPGALPEGLAAFTPFVGVESSSPEGMVDVRVVLIVEENRCAVEDLPRLGVYGYDEEAGWAPLEGAERDLLEGTIAGRDGMVRVYAVLGPASCLRGSGPAADGDG